MKGFSKYKILKEQKLIILFNQGNIDINDIKLCRERIINDKDFEPSYNLLLDLRYSKLKTTVDDVKEFGFFITENRELNKESIKVLLTNNPENVVYTLFLKSSIENDHYSYKILSSLAGSLSHLGVNKKYLYLVEDEIKQMTED